LTGFVLTDSSRPPTWPLPSNTTIFFFGFAFFNRHALYTPDTPPPTIAISIFSVAMFVSFSVTVRD
jgi:hypothetical protein